MKADIHYDGEDAILTLPDEIVKKFNLHPGDEVNFELLDNGSVAITFPKGENMVDVEIEIEDDLLLKLMLEAHKQDITLNQLVENILRKELYKKISVKEMEDGLIFDRVMSEVIAGGEYTIYEDKEYNKPLAKLMPYEE